MNKKMKISPFFLIGFFGILALVMTFWIVSLLRCEILTHLHYDEFKDVYQQNTMLPEKMVTFKVLDYSETSATVYYIGEGHSGGNVLEFELHEGEWRESGWRTIWSTSGSASEVVWPYWWHFVYGGL